MRLWAVVRPSVASPLNIKEVGGWPVQETLPPAFGRSRKCAPSIGACHSRRGVLAFAHSCHDSMGIHSFRDWKRVAEEGHKNIISVERQTI